MQPVIREVEMETTIVVPIEPVKTPHRTDRWREWARVTISSGRVIVLRRNRDFTCTTQTMQIEASQAAARLGYTQRTWVVDDDTIRIQFWEADDPRAPRKSNEHEQRP